jgi:hypothetical protein
MGAALGGQADSIRRTIESVEVRAPIERGVAAARRQGITLPGRSPGLSSGCFEREWLIGPIFQQLN